MLGMNNPKNLGMNNPNNVGISKDNPNIHHNPT